MDSQLLHLSKAEGDATALLCVAVGRDEKNKNRWRYQWRHVGAESARVGPDDGANFALSDSKLMN